MRTAAVVGTGLIGCSVGGALRHAGWFVRGLDVDRSVAGHAADLGYIDEACSSLESCLRGAEVAMLAGPVSAIVEMLPQVDMAASPEALLIDAGSVKGPVVAVMARLPGASRAIGGHPLAGSHRGGPGAADPDLFRDRPFLLCPSHATSGAALERAIALVGRLGAAPRVLTADEHDRALAGTSHLPQILSSLLASLPVDRSLTGSGYRDMTRLAASNPALWSDILRSNSVNVLIAIEEFRASLDRLARLLEAGDGPAVQAMLAAAQAAVAA